MQPISFFDVKMTSHAHAVDRRSHRSNANRVMDPNRPPKRRTESKCMTATQCHQGNRCAPTNRQVTFDSVKLECMPVAERRKKRERNLDKNASGMLRWFLLFRCYVFNEIISLSTFRVFNNWYATKRVFFFLLVRPSSFRSVSIVAFLESNAWHAIGSTVFTVFLRLWYFGNNSPTSMSYQNRNRMPSQKLFYFCRPRAPSADHKPHNARFSVICKTAFFPQRLRLQNIWKNNFVLLFFFGSPLPLSLTLIRWPLFLKFPSDTLWFAGRKKKTIFRCRRLHEAQWAKMVERERYSRVTTAPAQRLAVENSNYDRHWQTSQSTASYHHHLRRRHCRHSYSATDHWYPYEFHLFAENAATDCLRTGFVHSWANELRYIIH